MRVARYIGSRSIEIADVVPAEPGVGEVAVKVAFTGICGTDLHIFHGSMDSRVTTPLTFGHEMSGTVETLGADVVGWSVGGPVTVMPLVWDGTCAACRAGHSHLCHNLEFLGIDSAGSLQETWTVPASTLVALPEDLRLDHAALAEPVAVAVHDVRRAGVGAGDRVVVIGGGPIGTLIATVARDAGAEVLVVEPDEGRRSAIAALDFAVLDPQEVDQVATVDDWTEGVGADVVFEVSGSPVAVLGSTALARVRGTVVIVAIHPAPREIDLQRVFWRELTILGARVYERVDFEVAIDLLARGVIPADHLISRILPLDGVTEALTDLENGRGMKILIESRR